MPQSQPGESNDSYDFILWTNAPVGTQYYFQATTTDGHVKTGHGGTVPSAQWHLKLTLVQRPSDWTLAMYVWGPNGQPSTPTCTSSIHINQDGTIS